MIEKPTESRSSVIDNINNTTIIIPSEKKTYTVFFLSFWLIGWALGELTVLGSIFFIRDMPIKARLFMIVWFMGWTAGGYFAITTLLWQLYGKEIITVDNGVLNITRYIPYFEKTNYYDIYKIEDMGINPYYLEENEPWQGRSRYNNSFINSNQGKISFNYGNKTVRFGNNLYDVEAKKILDMLKKDRNFRKENFKDIV